MDKSVVVGTDGSPVADRAVEWAAEDAARLGRPLKIVHGVDRWIYTATAALTAGTQEYLTEVGEGILRDAAELALKRQPDLVVDTELTWDTAGYGLRERAAGAYEIVVGHRGLGGFRGLLLGSTGLQLAGHVPAPVVIVRGFAKEDQGRIAVGIDPGHACLATLEYAFEAARARGASLRVVHGWRRPETPPESTALPETGNLEEAARWAVVEATAELRRRYPEVETEETIVQGHPVEVLADVSREVDLVVVGSRDRNGLAVLRLGSVSHGVIHHAHCPVAVVRPRGTAAGED